LATSNVIGAAVFKLQSAGSSDAPRMISSPLAVSADSACASAEVTCELRRTEASKNLTIAIMVPQSGNVRNVIMSGTAALGVLNP